jgi:hypothetical protein
MGIATLDLDIRVSSFVEFTLGTLLTSGGNQMKKIMLVGMAIGVLFVVGCGDTSSDTPEGAVQLLYKNVKAGEMAAVKLQISSGYLDNYDVNYLRDCMGADEITGILTELVEEKDQRAKVRVTLVTESGNKEGRRPVALVYQDGSWKIDYSGSSWPTSLRSKNY